MRDVLLWLSTILYDYTEAPANIITSIFNLQFLSHFCMDFYSANTSRSAVKRPFNWYIIHICKLHSFRYTVEKPALIDTNYPWQGGAAVYKKIYILQCISPYVGHIRHTVDNKYINKSIPAKHSVNHQIKTEIDEGLQAVGAQVNIQVENTGLHTGKYTGRKYRLTYR